jgi:hypothetical protein
MLGQLPWLEPSGDHRHGWTASALLMKTGPICVEERGEWR